ncbi:hypothetical protein [Micromonospora sp. MH33]|uniref:hypothetical protein n=1 Tax=Micromonospora sp. MH33 TaxID=1945509 RepID=UPI0011B243C8|nr:hypothetical protein [Micromonospora sp. MH33]
MGPTGEHDNQRWEQEREERKEQWAREDESRWHQERLAAYSTLLNNIERWIRLARHAKPRAYLGQRAISRENAELLEAAVDEIQNAAITVELLAPEPIRGRVRALYVSTSFFRIDFSGNVRERSAQEAEQDAEATIEKVIERKNALRKLIRQELKIEMPAVGDASEIAKNPGA